MATVAPLVQVPRRHEGGSIRRGRLTEWPKQLGFPFELLLPTGKKASPRSQVGLKVRLANLWDCSWGTPPLSFGVLSSLDESGGRNLLVPPPHPGLEEHTPVERLGA